MRSMATRIVNLDLVLAHISSAVFDPLIAGMKVEMTPVDSRIQHGDLDSRATIRFWQKFVVDTTDTFSP